MDCGTNLLLLYPNPAILGVRKLTSRVIDCKIKIGYELTNQPRFFQELIHGVFVYSGGCLLAGYSGQFLTHNKLVFIRKNKERIKWAKLNLALLEQEGLFADYIYLILQEEMILK
jgi:hypothetical protein